MRRARHTLPKLARPAPQPRACSGWQPAHRPPPPAAVCKAVIDAIDKSVVSKERANVEKVEARMQTFCDAAKGKDKTMVRWASRPSGPLRS